MEKWTAGILIFDDVEILDFAGPFEVFSRTRLVPGPESRRSDDSAPFHVFTVAKTAAPIRTTGGLRVIPHYGFADAPQTDLVVVPGGWGTRALLHDVETLDWIRRTAARARQGSSRAGTRRRTGELWAPSTPSTRGSRWSASIGSWTTASSARLGWRRASTWPSTSWRASSAARSPTRPLTTSSIVETESRRSVCDRHP